MRKDGSRTIRAEVVRSFRDCVKDEPRNRTVCYLDSIRERDLSDAAALLSFWQTVDRKLSMLLIPVSQELLLKSKLAKRIPIPVGITSLLRIPRNELSKQFGTYNKPESDSTGEVIDAETSSVNELKSYLTELLRRVG